VAAVTVVVVQSPASGLLGSQAQFRVAFSAFGIASAQNENCCNSREYEDPVCVGQTRNSPLFPQPFPAISGSTIIKAMTVAVKRVYESPAQKDGVRVLVDRLWPRGLRKQDAAIESWLRDLAPSNELRKWFHAQPERWEEFRKRYLKELSAPKAQAALNKLYYLARRGTLTLLYASKNEEHNNATVLRDLLEGARKPPRGTGPSAAGAMRARRAARAPRR
jgi:uncharacterized protein YeaO (DUF488 family)